MKLLAMRFPILTSAGLLLLLNIQMSQSAMTEKQVQAAVKLIRNTCKNKIKIADEPIDEMRKGKFDDNNEKLKCYSHCALGMMKMQKKNGAPDEEAALKQLPQLPDSMRDAASISIKNCGNSGEGLTDKCDLSFSFFKCMYNDNPQNYFLP